MKLYRYYDSDGVLLYIGISHNPLGRLTQHQSEKLWAGEVVTITLEYFDNHDDAAIAERRAIQKEKPIYNVFTPSIICGKERGALVSRIRKIDLAVLEAASGVSRETLSRLRRACGSTDLETADAIWAGIEALDEAEREGSSQ